jgi:hypothetical protein
MLSMVGQMSHLKTKFDANHKSVASHLRRIGYDVLELMQPLDLLVTKAGTACFVEIKVPGSRARYTRTQLQFVASTRFNVIVAYSGEDAANKLRERRYLTQPQKDRLAALLAIEPRDFYTPATVDELLAK